MLRKHLTSASEILGAAMFAVGLIMWAPLPIVFMVGGAACVATGVLAA